MKVQTNQPITWEATIRKFIRYIPISETLRLRWTRALINREFEKELAEARKKGDRDEIGSIENSRSFEMYLIYEEEESIFTERLVNKAQRLRVHVPPKPKYTNDSEYEDSEDWQRGPQGTWSLTVLGIAKVREEIHKEEKWRREGRANWAVFLSALGGVIGTAIGLVAVFSK